MTDQTRRRRSRYGPAPLPADALRTHCVSVRLAPAELAELDSQRGPYRRGEWLRLAWQRALPPAPPPELNRRAWAELARAAANLNQLAHHLNGLAVARPVPVAEAAAAAPRTAPQPSPIPTDAREVARWPWVAELARRGVRVYPARLGGELVAVAIGDDGSGAEVLDSTGSLVQLIADRLPDPVTVTTGEPPGHTLAVSTAAAAAAAAADAERRGEAVRVISMGGLTRDQAEDVLRRKAARWVILALDDKDRSLASRLKQHLGSRCGGTMPPPPALTPPEPTAADVTEVARALADFRAALIGAQASDDEEESEP